MMIIVNYDYTLNGLYIFDYALTFYPNKNERFMNDRRRNTTQNKIDISLIPYHLQPTNRITKI